MSRPQAEVEPYIKGGNVPNEPTTVLEHNLKQMKSSGLNVHFAPRTVRPAETMRGNNALAFQHWIPTWVRNSYINFDRIKEALGINVLVRSAKRVPAIVVGIGPSLDKNVEALKFAQRNAIIIATDAAVRPLMANGVRPDIVINLDARDEQYTMWNSLDTTDLVLVAQSCTSPRTLDAWLGPTLFYNLRQDNSPFHADILPLIYPQLGNIPACGTVGNMAIALADMMGCTPILGVGMDFCYGDLGDGKWRYRCTDYELETVSVPNGAMLEDIHQWVPKENKVLYDNADRLKDAFDHVVEGVTYKTDKELMFYLDAFKNIVGEHNINFVDCSGGLLKTLVMSLPISQALTQYCSRELSCFETTAKHLSRLVQR